MNLSLTLAKHRVRTAQACACGFLSNAELDECSMFIAAFARCQHTVCFEGEKEPYEPQQEWEET